LRASGRPTRENRLLGVELAPLSPYRLTPKGLAKVAAFDVTKGSAEAEDRMMRQSLILVGPSLIALI
jgi:hypothetical protein